MPLKFVKHLCPLRRFTLTNLQILTTGNMVVKTDCDRLIRNWPFASFPLVQYSGRGRR